jgi:hypothetical protein
MTKGSKRAKVLVEIVGATRTVKRKLEVDETGSKPQIILKHGGMGRGDARETAKFDRGCLVNYTSGFLFLKKNRQKLMLKEGANECVNFSGVDIEAPTCGKDDVRRYGRATVLKLAGRMDKPESRMILYILLLVAIVLVGINLGVSTGHIRI